MVLKVLNLRKESNPMLIFKGRRLTSVTVQDIDFKDYPDFCDAFIESASWEDTGEALTDDELDQVNEDGELRWDAVHSAIY
jgi:hypothetical protein